MKRNLIFFACFFFARLMSIYSCDESLRVAPNPPENIIYGRAVLEGSGDHGGILVRLIQSGDYTYTDTGGRFSFTDQQPGTFTVVTTCEGYVPTFAIAYIEELPHEVPKLILPKMPHCCAADSIPPGYTMAVNFWTDVSFTVLASSYTVGDSIFISSYELFSKSLHVNAAPAQYEPNIVLLSSLGDKEIQPFDRVLGGIPEASRFGYIIDTAPSVTPLPYNGVLEIEKDGGRVTAVYLPYWLRLYICKTIHLTAGKKSPG
jgi:hypothetical protein